MAYDQILAKRIQALLPQMGAEQLDEKKMFGGVCYLTSGNMACGVIQEYLIVRVGKEQYTGALAQQHTRPFDITGRAMTGWVMVAPEGLEDEASLRGWMEKGFDFASTLPPK